MEHLVKHEAATSMCNLHCHVLVWCHFFSIKWTEHHLPLQDALLLQSQRLSCQRVNEFWSKENKIVLLHVPAEEAD